MILEYFTDPVFHKHCTSFWHTAEHTKLLMFYVCCNNLIISHNLLNYPLYNLPLQEEIKNFVAYASNKGLEPLLGCDVNSHHEVWGSTDVNPRGESLLDFIMCTKLHILNRGREPVFLDSRRQEVFDITLCIRGLTSLVRDLRVSSKPSGLDQRQIHDALDQIHSGVGGGGGGEGGPPRVKMGGGKGVGGGCKVK
jgi:hypothetical protein